MGGKNGFFGSIALESLTSNPRVKGIFRKILATEKSFCFYKAHELAVNNSIPLNVTGNSFSQLPQMSCLEDWNVQNISLVTSMSPISNK